ncbi:hypothetical protein [Mycobacterium intracellulare]|uniref:hypothetical protein n=1 Tax=Mycobacterium intracellulare TaxID=1767 RepID=UPI0013DE9652|nr:hypothetical protein [Mycobacterium intracellulare]
MQNPFSGEGKADIMRRLPNVPSETVDDYVEDSWAKAMAVAPCIGEDDFPEAEKAGQVKAILRGIILRWHEAQSGAVTGRTQAAGPYSQALQLDQRPKRGYVLQPSEIVDLQRLCERKGQMFSIDTAPDIADTYPKTFANGPHPG